MKISKLAGVVCGAAFLLGTRVALADISIGDSGATVNFTGFTAAGFQPTPGAGQLSSNDWSISGFSDGDLNFGSTNTSADYTRGATLTATGGIYAPTSTSVFLGIRLSDADFSPGVITARFKSAVAHPLVRLAIAYDVLVFNDNDRSSSVNFSWSTDGTNFTAVAALSNPTPTTATTPTPAWVVTNKTTTLTNIRIVTDGLLYLRWTSDDVPGGAGSRDAIGLDNITVTPQGACGDAQLNSGEGCDDGNTVNTDACTNACAQGICGDDIVRTGVEECDGTVCCGVENTPNECERLTGTTCPGGMCSNGTCVPNSSGNGGESGDTGMAGDTSMAGDTGMGGAGEGGTAAGRGGRTGRGGRGGMAGDAAGGVPAAGTSGAPAAGSAGAPAAGSAGTGGTATAGSSSGGAASGGKAGSAGTGNTGGKGGTSGSGGSGTKPPSSSSDDDSGCGCSVPRSSNHGTLALVFAGALLTFLRRRRS